MTDAELKLIELYQDNWQYIRKLKHILPLCSNDYLQEGNFRLLFGSFLGDYFGDDVLIEPKLSDLMGIPSKIKDYDYMKTSIEYYKEHEFDYECCSEEINIYNINRNINGERKNNFGYIYFDPFEKDTVLNDINGNNILQLFITKQIALLKPDAIIIGCQVTGASELWDDNYQFRNRPKIEQIFGNNIVFYPPPLPASFIRKYGDDVNHIAIIESDIIKDTKIYVYTWDNYLEQDYVFDYLKVISNIIITNK